MDFSEIFGSISALFLKLKGLPLDVFSQNMAPPPPPPQNEH